jgi:uncharacterized coiled-coil DUF342 family protein
MGFLGSIFGKKKEAEVRSTWPADRVKLEMSAVLGWMDSEFGHDMDSERKRFGSISKDLLGMTRDFQKSIYSIRGKGFEQGDRTYAAVNMIKDTWAKKALMSLSSYYRDINEEAASSGSMGFRDFRDMFHSTVKLMNEFSMVPKQRVVLSRYFEKESSRMTGMLRSMGDKLKEMRSLVDGKSKLKIYGEIEKKLNDFEELRKEIPSLDEKLNGMKEDLEKKKNELSRAREDLDSLEKSPKWKEMDRLKRKLERCEKKSEEVENGIIGRLGDFKRLMKLYSHDCRQLGKAEKKLAEDISHSPLKAYLSNDASAVHNLFKQLLLNVKTGMFAVPEKDRSKAGRIKDIVDTGWLATIRSEYDEAREECTEYRQKIGKIKVTVETKEAERSAEKTKTDAKYLGQQVAALEEKINFKKSEMKTKKKEIADYIHKELGFEVELI